MKKRLLFLLLLSIFTFQRKAHACSCKKIIWSPKLINWHFYTSEVIFIGEPILIETKPETAISYSLKVVEVLKGNVKDDTLIGKFWTSCSTSPRTKGQWIIYSEQVDNDSISFSDCSLSRNITTLIDYQPGKNIKLDSVDFVKRKHYWEKEYLMLKQLVEREEREQIAIKVLTYSAVGLILIISFYLVLDHKFKKNTSLR